MFQMSNIIGQLITRGKKIMTTKKGQITSSFESGDVWRNLAKNLNVLEGTAYRWVAQGNNPDERESSFNTKVLEIYRDEMVKLIEANNRITLQEMVESIENKLI